ncbi:MAG: energy transducer TonB [Treponema sp.]|nr:energy transducer TonB [Treponema sp.]
MNDKILRLAIIITVTVLHALIILFLAFNYNAVLQDGPENARVMKLTDLAEEPPPPEEDLPQVEAIAETMIETDTTPLQNVVAPGTFLTANEYLPMHRLSQPPRFDENQIAADLIYPPIALRSGIEGRVILELFVDLYGVVQQVRVLQETPDGRGFGEAAIRAFTGRKGSPAIANGSAVSARYRYPVTFRIR